VSNRICSYIIYVSTFLKKIALIIWKISYLYKDWHSPTVFFLYLSIRFIIDKHYIEIVLFCYESFSLSHFVSIPRIIKRIQYNYCIRNDLFAIKNFARLQQALTSWSYIAPKYIVFWIVAYIQIAYSLRTTFLTLGRNTRLFITISNLYSCVYSTN